MRVGYNSSLDNCKSYCREPVVSPAYVYVSLTLVVFCTVCGNVIVVISVSYFKQLHTPTNVLIMSLALADVSVGAFVMPLHFVWLIESCWIFGKTLCIMFNFSAFYFTSVSVHTVALIAVDRYLALNNPFFYHNKITTALMIIVVVLNWMCSLVYNSLFLHSNEVFIQPFCPGDCYVEINVAWFWVDFVVVFAVPSFIMFILYLQVFDIATRHAKAIRAVNNLDTTNNSMPKQHESKAAKVLGIIVFVFLFCLVPYYTTIFMSDILPAKIVNNMSHFITTLVQLNSLFNPLIYALFYPWFRRCVRLIWKSLCCPQCSPMHSNIHWNLKW